MLPAEPSHPLVIEFVMPYALMRYLQAFDDDVDEHSLVRLRNMVSAILQVESGFQEWHLGQDYSVVFLMFDEVFFSNVATLKYI